MKNLIEANIAINWDERTKQGFRNGAEFVHRMVLKKMKELLDDEWLSDDEVLTKLYDFLNK